MALDWNTISPEVAAIVAQQRDWAIRNNRALNTNETGFADASLGFFRGELGPDTYREMEQGAGNELEVIHSLRSSACLGVNVFEPWRPSPSGLSDLFGVKATSLSFEAQQPISHYWKTAPHLDVLLTGPGPSVGIEAKYLEMYASARNAFDDVYFAQERLWEGLRDCQRLARELSANPELFRWLQAGQLIKHALGLSRNQERGFRLVLVWYRVDGRTADEIEVEIGRFTRAVSADFDFTAITYQELISNMLSMRLREPAEGYFSYLEDRYRLGLNPPRRLPLLARSEEPSVGRRTGLAETISRTAPHDVVSDYHGTVALAPQRPVMSKMFLVDGHDGAGGHAERSREKRAAKALFNRHAPVAIGGDEVVIVDYEVPLQSRQADRGVGDIDLLGVDDSGRPWIIELKIWPSSDTPFEALLQVLRYSAIVDANRHRFATELEATTGVKPTWPTIVAVVADQPYWTDWLSSRESGAWLEALSQLSIQVGAQLGVDVRLLDLGELVVETVDGVAQLSSELAIREVTNPRAHDR